MIRLRLLGNPSIVGDDGAPLTGAATQRHRVALLALLAVAGDRGQSRDKLMAYLWPDRDAERARQLLNQAVYSLRKALGEDALLSEGESLRLNPQAVDADVVQFEAALARGDDSSAAALYQGPFVDGLFLSEAPEFERWTDRERARLAAGYAKALESLAEAAEAARDFTRAVDRWKSRAAQDPYDSRVVFHLMQALEASGNPAGALQQAGIHQRLLQQEFGTQPSPEVMALAERLRREPATISRSIAAPGAVVVLDRELEPAALADFERITSSPAHPSSDGAISSASASLIRPNTRRTRWYAVVTLLLCVALVGLVWKNMPRGRAAAPRATAGSVAVLPLANQSADPRDASFADGMTDELIAILAKTSGLRVIASTSVVAYRNRSVDVRAVAETLGVANILEGGVQKDGDRLRVRVRLLDGRDGSTRWSETYDRQLRDVFAVQDEIAHAVARELGLRIGLYSETADRRQPTANVAAYELYLRANDRTALRSDSAARASLDLFRQAIDLDSTYAGAWAGLSRMYSRLAVGVPRAERERYYTLAEEAAHKAISLDDSLAEAHAILGALRISSFDFAGAERELSRAIAIDPGRPLPHEWISGLYVWTGQTREALMHAEKALELDPLASEARADFARALLANGRCDEALAQLKPLLLLRPPLLRVAPLVSWCYAERRMWPEAIAALRPQVERGDWLAKGQFGYLLARGGHRDEALRLRATLMDEWQRGQSDAFQIALVSAGLGDMDQTFEWLDRSFEDYSLRSVPGSVGHLLIRGPLFDDLQRDPRFQRTRARLHLAAQQP